MTLERKLYKGSQSGTVRPGHYPRQCEHSRCHGNTGKRVTGLLIETRNKIRMIRGIVYPVNRRWNLRSGLLPENKSWCGGPSLIKLRDLRQEEHS